MTKTQIFPRSLRYDLVAMRDNIGNCLIRLAQGGDIPMKVLMSLPSPEEILRRAEEAKAKAAALQKQANSSTVQP